VKKRLWLMTFIFVLLSFSVTGYAEKLTTEQKVSQVIAFGDSLTDNGASLKISQDIMKMSNKPSDATLLPADPAAKLYWNGRWSNGPTAVEVLAKALKVNLTDYAVGGAKSGKDNYYDWINKEEDTGVLGQIGEFETSLNGKKADSNALYFIFISANDYFQYMDYQQSGTIDTLDKKTVDNIALAITELSKTGANHFMIVCSIDLSLEPWEVTNGRTKQAKEYTEDLNKDLTANVPALAKKLNVDILLFNPTVISNKIRANPNYYGLKELNKPFEHTYPTVIAGQGNPDEYYFWDEWHPTSAVHKIFGEEMLKEIQNHKYSPMN